MAVSSGTPAFAGACTLITTESPAVAAHAGAVPATILYKVKTVSPFGATGIASGIFDVTEMV